MSRRGSVLAALALAGGSTIAYVATGQRALFSDGVFFVGMIERGQLLYPHLLYLPLVAALRLALEPFVALAPETLLKVLSALAGGAGVAVGYFVALAILDSSIAALSAAVLLAVLPGYWFFATATEVHAIHGACAGLFLFGLVCALRELGPRGRRSALLFGSALLTPASHASGVAAILPAVYTWWGVAGRRTQVFLSAVLPLLLFVCLYLGLYVAWPPIRGYSDNFRGLHGMLLQHPERISAILQTGASELLLYAVPASTLLPAGLRVLLRRSPPVGGLCLVWVLAWPLVAFPVGVHEYGGYYVPTFFAQAPVAVVALATMARSGAWAVLGVALSLLPGVAHLWSEAFGLWTYAAAATVLFVLCRGADRVPDRPVGALLPAAALAFSALVFVPRFALDPVRDRMRAVAAIAGPQALVLVVEYNGGFHAQWKRVLPDAGGAERVINLAALTYFPAQAAAHATRWRDRIQRHLERGNPVYALWVVGSPSARDPASVFLQSLAATYAGTVVDSSLPLVRFSLREAPSPPGGGSARPGAS